MCPGSGMYQLRCAPTLACPASGVRWLRSVGSCRSQQEAGAQYLHNKKQGDDLKQQGWWQTQVLLWLMIVMLYAKRMPVTAADVPGPRWGRS